MANNEISMQDKNNDNIILSVRHLSHHFGKLKAVDDVSFDVKEGEVLGLVGESGCGKTTIGRTIIKLYSATDGEVFLNGKRIVAGTLSLKKSKKDAFKNLLSKIKKIYKRNGWSEFIAAYKNYKQIKRDVNPKIAKAVQDQKKNKALEIQMIFQDPIASLDPRMVVHDIITEGLVINGEKDKALIEKKLYEILESIGLVREHATRYPHEFSGGQRQRIGIARAVIMNPKVLIADEPVSALDVSIQAQVITLLNEIKNALNLTIIFIAHDISVIKYFSDKIAVMFNGKIMEMASTEELFKNPIHPYTRSLLSAIPQPDPEYEKIRKRVTYNPLIDHDYSSEKPSYHYLKANHQIYCSESEFEKYKLLLKD